MPLVTVLLVVIIPIVSYQLDGSLNDQRLPVPSGNYHKTVSLPSDKIVFTLDCVWAHEPH